MTPIERAAIRLVDARAEVRNARHELGRVQQALEDPADALARRRAAGFRAAGAMRSLTWAVRKEREAGRAGATLPVAASEGEKGRVGRGGDSRGAEGEKRHMIDPIQPKEVHHDEAQKAEEAEEVITGRPLLRVLSLGAGVQSSTLYLMAVRGEFGSEGPTVAVFADTQWEPAHTYRWLDEMERIGGDVVPIQRVTIGSLRADIVSGVNRGYRIANMPFYTKNLDGTRILMRRTCTSEYKITPLSRATRAIIDAERMRLGVTGRLTPGCVEQWIGISTDEATRQRDSQTAYVTNRYPLIERRMSREDCKAWLSINGFPEPPKSACIGCPFHDDAFWLEMREQRPDEWRDAVEFDRFIREFGGKDETGQMRGMRNGGEAFLHRSLLPLDQVPLSQAEKAAAGDAKRPMVNMWETDCSGSCGV